PYTQEPNMVELHGEEITIGRAGSSDILLDRDDLTSRHHALLKCDNDHFLIFDRRSANCVQVNGLPIQSEKGYPLIDGDHITIVKSPLCCFILASTEWPPLTSDTKSHF